jgi:hypothetical protein
MIAHAPTKHCGTLHRHSRPFPTPAKLCPGKIETTSTSQGDVHEHHHDRQAPYSHRADRFRRTVRIVEQPELQTRARLLKGRVILLNRDLVLTEQTPTSFAEEHAFEWLVDDQIALNRRVAFKVETFEPREGFTPAKPFKTRLKWRDPAGLD